MIEDKAKDLGRLVGQSTEYQAVKRASDALNEDKDTVAMLQKMEQLRVNAQRMMQRGERPTAKRARRIRSWQQVEQLPRAIELFNLGPHGRIAGQRLFHVARSGLRQLTVEVCDELFGEGL